MTFSINTVKELDKKLNPANVSKRVQAGEELFYIEAWHAISEANRIFGYDGWSRETVYCKEVCQYKRPSKKQGVENFEVGYEAKVRVTIGGVVREGTGHGNGIAKFLFDAIEGAAKEAESDATKRCLMTFGSQFGLALRDKTLANVGVDIEYVSEEQRDKIIATIDELEVDIAAFCKHIKVASIAEIPSDWFDDVCKLLDMKRKAMENKND